MVSSRKLYMKALNSPANLRFAELVRLATAFGFVLERTEGSHHVLRHPGVREILNIQPDHGRAKAYQVRELLTYVRDYHLNLEERS
ncbi:MAG: type II toxin-antitoxin system HicA family toxin [Thermomicrobiales bacterium]